MLLFLIVTINAYNVEYPGNINLFRGENDLFEREKCQTCCKTMIVSDYDFGGEYYTMDMEFATKNQVREHKSDWEQTILLNPIKQNRVLQFFELAAYKMINSFSIPKRVHDIRSGIKLNNKLIIWNKKPPLSVSTNNQRFVYNYPYSFIKNDFKKHFQAPFYTDDDVCYEISFTKQYWTGNNLNNRPTMSEYYYENGIKERYDYNSNEYQIKISKCEKNNIKQQFTLVYA